MSGREEAKEVAFKKAYGDLKKTKEEVDQDRRLDGRPVLLGGRAQ